MNRFSGREPMIRPELRSFSAMGVVIEFREIVERRRRRRRRESLERCVEIIEINLAYARWMADWGTEAERLLYARRAQTLRALRDYAARVL